MRTYVSIACVFLAAQLAMAQDKPVAAFEPGTLLVKFREPDWMGARVAVWADGARVASEIPSLGVTRIRLSPRRSLQAALRYYRSLRAVEYAEPNYVFHADFTPNDPQFANQYAHQKIQSQSAWNLCQGSPSVIIAIVDTGTDYTHPDLQGKVVAGFDFVNNDADPMDDNGHGTHCAGIAAANTNNSVGVAGVGFNCSVMPVKVLNAAGSGYLDAVANGVTYAVDHGAKVVSMSLGGGSGTLTLQNAVDYAWNHGVVVVAAAGNSSTTTPSYPAFYTNCIAVASTDSNDLRSSFSNYGTWVDVAAPGSNILSTVPGGGYEYWSGTSMATPAVAGLAGLLYAYLGPSTPSATIRARIENNCDPVGSFVVKGRVNAYKALNQAQSLVLNSLSLSAPSAWGGSAVTGTVSLTGNAPSGGVTVALARSTTSVTIPASVVVPAGQSSVNFPVSTSIVYYNVNATITASLNGVSRQAGLLIYPAPQLSSLSISPSVARGPASAQGIVRLNVAAPVGGWVVTLSSTKPGVAGVPASITVPVGQTSAAFNCSLFRVTTVQSATISASASGATKYVMVTVTP